MASFNYVHHEAPCPACGNETDLVFQLHVASSFDGDRNGRFCLRSFRLGDQIPWWEPTDQKFPTWSAELEPSEILDTPGMVAKEHCLGVCSDCKTELAAFIMVKEFVIEKIFSIQTGHLNNLSSKTCNLIPLKIEVPIRQDRCELVEVSWKAEILNLRFETAEGVRVRAVCKDVKGYKIIDEILQSIEGEAYTGANQSGFAYASAHRAFLSCYRNADIYAPSKNGQLRQYIIISLNWCIEILANSQPVFEPDQL